MENQKKNLGLPIAIVIAAIIIGVAIIYSANSPKPATNKQPAQTSVSAMKAVSADDHILGSPKADIVLVEYSDLECPFCKQFHATLHKLLDEYGKGDNPKLAWVYREFPLDKPIQQADGTTFVLHSKAGNEAQAAECAGDVGGNSKFWDFIDKIYFITPSNNNLDPVLLGKTAKDIGLDTEKFNACLSSGKMKNKVEAMYQDGAASGASGTPFSVLVVTKTGDRIPISQGALPYIQMKTIIDSILSDLNKK